MEWLMHQMSKTLVYKITSFVYFCLSKILKHATKTMKQKRMKEKPKHRQNRDQTCLKRKKDMQKQNKNSKY